MNHEHPILLTIRNATRIETLINSVACNENLAETEAASDLITAALKKAYELGRSAMPIYVVTAGEYSNYGICALFSTTGAAQAFIDASEEHTPGGEYGIETYLLDKHLQPTKRRGWQAHIDMEDGELKRTESVELVAGANVRSLPPHNHAWRLPQGYYKWTDVISFVSEDHARKLAVEARQKLIREHLCTPKTSR